MAETFMAHPELRHPFERSSIHPEGSVTVLYQGRTHTLETTGSGERPLVRPTALSAVNGFELKTEGACLGELCYPLPEAVLVEENGAQWFDLAAFADHIGQPSRFGEGHTFGSDKNDLEGFCHTRLQAYG